jgi:hypothetical protein
MSIRIALRESVTRDDIDDAMVRRGWRLCNIVPAAEEHPFQMIFTDAARTATIHIIDDQRLGVLYCVTTEPLAAEVKGELPFYSDDEIRALEGDRLAALAAIALPREEAARILASADPRVREIVEPYLG